MGRYLSHWDILSFSDVLSAEIWNTVYYANVTPKFMSVFQARFHLYCISQITDRCTISLLLFLFLAVAAQSVTTSFQSTEQQMKDPTY